MRCGSDNKGISFSLMVFSYFWCGVIYGANGPGESEYVVILIIIQHICMYISKVC